MMLKAWKFVKMTMSYLSLQNNFYLFFLILLYKMRNKYIYLSSLDSNNHADFEVNLPKQLMIAPYSQVRCVSARINPSDNLIEIDDTNDLFYVGIDHWNKLASSVPLSPIQMNKALYNLEDVNSAGLTLTQEIEDKLNAQLKSMCLVRNGGAC